MSGTKTPHGCLGRSALGAAAALLKGIDQKGKKTAELGHAMGSTPIAVLPAAQGGQHIPAHIKKLLTPDRLRACSAEAYLDTNTAATFVVHLPGLMACNPRQPMTFIHPYLSCGRAARQEIAYSVSAKATPLGGRRVPRTARNVDAALSTCHMVPCHVCGSHACSRCRFRPPCEAQRSRSGSLPLFGRRVRSVHPSMAFLTPPSCQWSTANKSRGAPAQENMGAG